MKYVYKKVLCRQTMITETISKWYQPAGFDVSLCQLQAPMFGFVFTLIYGKYSEWEKFMYKHHSREADNDNPLAVYAWTIDPSSKEKVKYLLITENNWSGQDYGTIAHELHHLTHMSLDDIGIKYGGSVNEELFAYFQGYFMELVVRAFVALKQATVKPLPKKKKK